jgi:hypothetical protein
MENEILLAIDLGVTCADGSNHDGVVMKIINDKTIYLTKNGLELDSNQKVITIDTGTFVQDLMFITHAIEKYREDNP